jgi:bacteriorhodopsin
MEYSVITNMMSFSIAAMFAGALFFFFSRQTVAPRYRTAMLITALVPAIACYHYVRIQTSFADAYALENGRYVPTGAMFNDAYRYADWLLTVPLLVIELVAVCALSKVKTRSLSTKLAVAAAVMILLGFPGEIASNPFVKILWWILSMIPFVYILKVLFNEFTQSVNDQPKPVKPLIYWARNVIVITWAFYPIAYLAGLVTGSLGETVLQVGYTIADITAKVGLGIFIYFIAVAKSEADGWSADAAPTGVVPSLDQYDEDKESGKSGKQKPATA